jgi:hypothetical protein
MASRGSDSMCIVFGPAFPAAIWSWKWMLVRNSVLHNVRVDAGKQALIIGQYDIDSVSAQPDGYQTIWLGNLLKWNKTVTCSGHELIEYSIAAWNLCQQDKAIAESAYRRLYNSCVELDEQVAPIDTTNKFMLERWNNFCRKSTRLLLLRQAFMEVHHHEPCCMHAQSETAVEGERLVPAPRRLAPRSVLKPSSVCYHILRCTCNTGSVWVRLLRSSIEHLLCCKVRYVC